MAVVQENREYQRILPSDNSVAVLERNGFEPVFSSNVSAVATSGKDLVIRFHNGSIYSYTNQAKNYDRLIASASKGKWVWRFLRKPNVPYQKIGSLPLPEDVDRDDVAIQEQRPPQYQIDTIVPPNYMETGELPQIRIIPLNVIPKVMGGSEMLSTLVDSTLLSIIDVTLASTII